MQDMDHNIHHHGAHVLLDHLFAIVRLQNLNDPLIHLRRSLFMTRKRALITILIFFIWLYSVLFAAIPSMGWRDAPGANPLFLKVFGGFLIPKLTLYLQLPELLSTVYYHQRYSYQDLRHCT